MAWRDELRRTCTDPDVCQAVIDALTEFLERDRYLLQVDASERSMAHRLGVYLERRFAGWNIDCEYNRDGHRPKEVHLGQEADSEYGSRVLPDIIVHNRGSDDNLLAVEIKKSTNPIGDDLDLAKLAAYRRDLGYLHRLFVRFQVYEPDGDISVAVFVN
jgi:hypothetical protein